MHILTIPATTDLGPQGAMPAGEYLLEDRNAAELMLMNPGSKMFHMSHEMGHTSDKLETKKFIKNLFGEQITSILIVGTLGFGDAILLTPCLRAIKRMHPDATLTLATFHEYRQVFLGLHYVDGFEEYPVPVARLSNYDCVLFLERSIESGPDSRMLHMTDLFAKHLGLEELKDKTADYRVSDAEFQWVKDSFPRTSKRRIGVQVQAGTRSRSYPKTGLLVEALRRDKWEVYLIGRPGEFRADGQKTADVVDLSRLGLTWRQSVAALTSCDAFLGPDSSMLHAAGTLNIPSVGLFGPYPWKLRTAYYKSVFAMQGTEGCDIAPCFHTQHLGQPVMPANGPCASTGRCAALESILPSKIVAKINQITAGT